RKRNKNSWHHRRLPTLSRIITSALALTLLAAAHRAPTANPAITVTVDAAVNRHAIDPRIYGVAFADATSQATNDLGITINRWGGNAMSRYNWAISTANRCKDYYFENILDDTGGADPANGKSADLFIQPTLARG